MMKKVLTAVTIMALAVTSLTTLGGCAENLTETGNNIVSSAKDYAKSEIGVDSDISSISQVGGKAVSYLNEELGLNNASNKVLEGTWNTKKGESGDWQWTFDGKQSCKLKSKENKSTSEGTYSVDENAKTVEICLYEWDETIPFTYRLQQTLSDEYLTLTSESETYSLVKAK